MFSNWFKADLHIHTDKSNETKYNDYKGRFCVDTLHGKLLENRVELISLTDHNTINCDAYRSFLVKTPIIEFLVGIELDIALDKSKLISYMEAQQSHTKIEFKPFHALVIFKSKNLEILSQSIDSMYEKIASDVGIDCNCNKYLRITTFEYLLESLENEDYFIIAHGNKSKNIISAHNATGGLHNLKYSILLGDISALEMKSAINKKGVIERCNQELQLLLSDDFENNTTSYVCFSDNHDCCNYQSPEQSTWFKGSCDYETLTLAFSDPESRIHTSDKGPTHVSEYIEEINFRPKSSDPQCIRLSPYLNVIIGGRSSGKSLLLNTLIFLNEQFGVQEKKTFKEAYETIVDLTATKIKTNNCQLSSNVSYKGVAYCQEDVINLFKNNENLHQQLADLFDAFDDLEIRKIEQNILTIFANFKQTYNDYYTYYRKVNKGDKSGIIKLAEQSGNRVYSILLTDLTSDYSVDYHQDVLLKLGEISEHIKELKIIKYKEYDLFSHEEQQEIDSVKKLIELKKSIIEESSKKARLKELFFRVLGEIDSEYVEHELGQEQRDIESAKNTLIYDLEDIKDYFKYKLALFKACTQIESLDFMIADKISTTPDYDFISKVNLNMTKSVIIDSFFVLKILKFDLTKSIYDNMLMLASASYPDVRLRNITGDRGKLPLEFAAKIDEFLNENKARYQYEIVEKKGQMSNTSSTSAGKKASMFLDIKLHQFIEKRGYRVLVIDQLEDNIDNKYVSLNLVPILRKLKRTMQLILVTHNPSIAIYGDAENIIIAENTDGVFSYKQGGLENEDIRRDACQILDGGRVAFRNRMDKYRITKIKQIGGT